MTEQTLVLIAIAWPLIGIWFLYLDWTRSFDMTVGDAMLTVLCGAMQGPIAIIIYAAGSGAGGAFFGRVIKRKRAKRGQL